MSWEKREAVSNLVVLGDGKDNKKVVGGLLIGCPYDKHYEKTDYTIVQNSGEEVRLAGSASLARQITEDDVGKFVKCSFKGWGSSGNGKFKDIEVNVWNGPPNDEMKAWPRFAEFANPKVPAKPEQQQGPEFDEEGETVVEDDGLPF